MNKVVFNACYGGYSLSKKAVQWLAENACEEVKAIANKELKETCSEYINKAYILHGVKRHCPDLVRCVETLNDEANGFLANLEIRELKGNKYRIEDYDGLETVYEPEDEEYITIDY